MRLGVRVQPRASRDAIVGERGGALLVRVQAPPVDGAANEAVRRLLARALGLPPSAVRVLRGESARDKQVWVAGVRMEHVRQLAAGAGEPG